MEQLRRVLYVDDDPSVCELVEVALEATSDLELRTCLSGKEALDEIKTFDAQLLVIDVNMREMDGPETVSALKRAGVRIPIIFTTAETDPETHIQLRGLGSLDVLIKPFDPLTLQQRLHNLWDSVADA